MLLGNNFFVEYPNFRRSGYARVKPTQIGACMRKKQRLERNWVKVIRLNAGRTPEAANVVQGTKITYKTCPQSLP